MITKSSAEAQNNFGQLLDTAQREPVAITRHGRTTAFLISTADMEDLMTVRRQRQSAVVAFENWAKNFDGQLSADAKRLTDEEINRMVHEARDEAAAGS